MGNYADSRDAGQFDTKKTTTSTSNDMGQSAQDIYNARGGYSGTGMSLRDFEQKGDLNPTSGGGTTAVRRRGSSEQTRVGNDTRVRDDASSGTAGAKGSSIGQAMAESSGSPLGQSVQNGLWQATRQPTDLASIQQRVLQSLTNPTKRGM
nr:MAG: hypothetical protein [Bacteriophage sp.]